MMKRKSNSLIWQLVLFPVGTVGIILLISIYLCIFSINILSNREIETNRNALKISLNQLQSELHQVDGAFAEYLSTSKSYAYLSQITQRAPIDMFLEYQLETVNWMNNQVRMYANVLGAFTYYENLDLLLFRGITNDKMHDYIRSQLNADREYNHWELVLVGDQWFLITIKKYNNFYGGVWLSVEKIMEQLSIDEDVLVGNIYMMDWKYENTAAQADIHHLLKAAGHDPVENAEAIVELEGASYYNNLISTQEGDVSFGILIPRDFFYSRIPLTVKWIVVLLIMSVLLVPLLILWLRKKIALPIKALDTAMKAVGEGDIGYRIREVAVKRPNELERLIGGFNHMVDEINTLEINLYQTKIREQKIKLKYISQMIRPHFVLNALNIIYTYREDEFFLVKRMISYLMEYFRYIVYLKTDFVLLEQEMHHIENYLKIQKERYLDAFDFFVEWESECSHCMIPPLVIQTFAENCLKYGKRDDDEMFVYVLASRMDGRLRLRIADSGNGFSDEMLYKLRHFIETRTYSDELGVGIQNAIERMDLLYEEKVDVKIYNALSGGAVVELLLPITV